MITTLVELIAVINLCGHFDVHLRTQKADYGNNDRVTLVIYGEPRQCSDLYAMIDTDKIKSFTWKDHGDRYATVNIPMTQAMQALWNVAT